MTDRPPEKTIRRILVFCARSWLSPRAGAVEAYAHEVFSRIAAKGHFVAWVCHHSSVWTWLREGRPTLERVNGIQIARLGNGLLYPYMLGRLLKGLEGAGQLSGHFDAVIPCVTGVVHTLPRFRELSVIPLVFSLSGGVRAEAFGADTVLAATRRAWYQLSRAGVDGSRVSSAPYAATVSVQPSRAERPLLLVVGEPRRALDASLASLERDMPNLDMAWASALRDAVDDASQDGLPARAWAAYCDAGFEWHALSLGACRVPVVCPATDAGREFVIDGETGLLHEPGDTRGLEDCLRRLLGDTGLRRRLGERAFERARMTSWDKTADAVLDAIGRAPRGGGEAERPGVV